MTASSHDRSSAVLQEQFAAWIRPGLSILDVTYGQGGFWTWPHGCDLTASDINPAAPCPLHLDFRALALPDLSFDVVVFDPPFTSSGHSAWSDRYGICRVHGGPRNQKELAWWIDDGARGACRVARRAVLVKLKACVESGQVRDHWPYIRAVADRAGFRPVKEFTTFGHRPQPGGRTYTTTVRPTIYVMFQREGAV